jgi:hypothetical protein
MFPSLDYLKPAAPPSPSRLARMGFRFRLQCTFALLILVYIPFPLARVFIPVRTWYTLPGPSNQRATGLSSYRHKFGCSIDVMNFTIRSFEFFHNQIAPLIVTISRFIKACK